MSLTVRPYVTGGWEVDIRVVLPDGTVLRERKKAQQPSESSARRWAEARERHLLLHGKPKPIREEVEKTPTLREFAPRFLDGYAKANRLKPSGVSSKEVPSGCTCFRGSGTSDWMRSRPRTCSS